MRLCVLIRRLDAANRMARSGVGAANRQQDAANKQRKETRSPQEIIESLRGKKPEARLSDME